jgi:hypothetical protein
MLFISSATGLKRKPLIQNRSRKRLRHNHATPLDRPVPLESPFVAEPFLARRFQNHSTIVVRVLSFHKQLVQLDVQARILHLADQQHRDNSRAPIVNKQTICHATRCIHEIVSYLEAFPD